MTIGARLMEERNRLGMNQTDFAARGGVGKATQINYEKGERSPDADYLGAVAKVGVDVLYVVTGTRSSSASLSEAESELLTRLRQGSPALHGYLQEFGRGATAGGNAVNIGGDVGQQVNGDQTVTGPMTFKVGGKRK